VHMCVSAAAVSASTVVVVPSCCLAVASWTEENCSVQENCTHSVQNVPGATGLPFAVPAQGIDMFIPNWVA
jgi:hypothetical protein